MAISLRLLLHLVRWNIEPNHHTDKLGLTRNKTGKLFIKSLICSVQSLRAQCIIQYLFKAFSISRCWRYHVLSIIKVRMLVRHFQFHIHRIVWIMYNKLTSNPNCFSKTWRACFSPLSQWSLSFLLQIISALPLLLPSDGLKEGVIALKSVGCS